MKLHVYESVIPSRRFLYDETRTPTETRRETRSVKGGWHWVNDVIEWHQAGKLERGTKIEPQNDQVGKLERGTRIEPQNDQVTGS